MHRVRFVLFAGIFASVLAGCAGTPSRSEIEADVSRAVQDQAPAVPASRQAPASIAEEQVGWVRSFDDPMLIQFVDEAQANNRDLAVAAANVDLARALARQAGAALTPDVGLSATTARAGNVEGDISATSNLNLGLQVSWEADVWGRIRSGVSAAEASAQAVEADYRYAQHSLAAITAKAYFTAIEANLQTEIVRETVEVLEETLRIVTVQYENGIGSGQDVALARSDLASARERLTATEGSLRDALRALEVLLGRYPSAELELRGELPEAPPAPPPGVPSELLERRPDIVAAERRVAAAFNTVQQAKAARLPTVGLTGDLGGASGTLSNLLDPTNVAWRLGANLLAPIFDGGARREAVEIATAEQEQALASYGQAALVAFREVETALDQGNVLSQRTADLMEAASEADEAFRIADLRYREGESDLLSVLIIQQRVIGAKSNLATVQRLLLDQRVDLQLALGGSWQG